jgi:LEA14-like dessication related protein
MNRKRLLASGAIFVLASMMGACASLEELVSAPGVSLRDVQVEKLGIEEQTFVLSFDVTNPNPFPLPVSQISYGVELNGHRFASGETPGAFTVPAGSDGEFAISVDVNLLRTAPELLFIVRDATKREIPYTLEGQLGVDLPYARPVRFENSGLIRLYASN